MINLFVNYYLDESSVRQQELDYCIAYNGGNYLIDRIVAVAGDDAVHHLQEIGEKLTIVVSSDRPSFNDFFKLTEMYPEDINIISNLDIYFNGSLDKVKEFYNTPENHKTCMALSRWDTPDQLHKNAHGSQDSWIFYGAVSFMQGTDFTLGVAGCDNKMAYIIEKNGYRVINPSKTIKCLHVHQSEIRNYNVHEDRKKILPPFKIIHPTEL